MTIKEIISTASTIVGRQDVYNHLNKTATTNNETLQTVEKMVNLINMVIEELAGTFIPMVVKQKMTSNSGKFYYVNFSKKPVEILGVYSEKDQPINYNQTAEYLEVNCNTVYVEYSYIPPVYNVNSEIGYDNNQISPSTLVYGLLAEYCVVMGAFDEAVMWHDRFVSGVKEKRTVRNSKIKGRCWA